MRVKRKPQAPSHRSFGQVSRKHGRKISRLKSTYGEKVLRANRKKLGLK